MARLSLNVWPPVAAAAPRPVLMYVHGGAFREGSGAVAVYLGASFAARGLVVVTINAVLLSLIEFYQV